MSGPFYMEMSIIDCVEKYQIISNRRCDPNNRR